MTNEDAHWKLNNGLLLVLDAQRSATQGKAEEAHRLIRVATATLAAVRFSKGRDAEA